MKSVLVLAGAFLLVGSVSAQMLGDRYDPYILYEDIPVTAPEEAVTTPPAYGDQYDPYVVSEELDIAPQRAYPEEPYIWDRFDPYSGKIAE